MRSIDQFQYVSTEFFRTFFYWINVMSVIRRITSYIHFHIMRKSAHQAPSRIKCEQLLRKYDRPNTSDDHIIMSNIRHILTTSDSYIIFDNILYLIIIISQ